MISEPAATNWELGTSSSPPSTTAMDKVWADTVEEAEKKLAASFTKLKTDYADVLYFHQGTGAEIAWADNSAGDGSIGWPPSAASTGNSGIS